MSCSPTRDIPQKYPPGSGAPQPHTATATPKTIPPSFLVPKKTKICGALLCPTHTQRGSWFRSKLRGKQRQLVPLQEEGCRVRPARSSANFTLAGCSLQPLLLVTPPAEQQRKHAAFLQSYRVAEISSFCFCAFFVFFFFPLAARSLLPKLGKKSKRANKYI